jgi:hypothetical protein
MQCSVRKKSHKGEQKTGYQFNGEGCAQDGTWRQSQKLTAANSEEWDHRWFLRVCVLSKFPFQRLPGVIDKDLGYRAVVSAQRAPSVARAKKDHSSWIYNTSWLWWTDCGQSLPWQGPCGRGGSDVLPAEPCVLGWAECLVGLEHSVGLSHRVCVGRQGRGGWEVIMDNLDQGLLGGLSRLGPWGATEFKKNFLYMRSTIQCCVKWLLQSSK